MNKVMVKYKMVKDSNIIRPNVPAWTPQPNAEIHLMIPKDLKQAAENIGQLTVGDVLSEDELISILNNE